MRPPARLWAPMILALVGACNESPEPRDPAVLEIHLDERQILVGEVVERLEGEHYVYLRLALVHERSAPAVSRPPSTRWVALEGRAPPLGQRVRVRSLAHRARVWDPSVERDFESLDYVALLAPL